MVALTDVTGEGHLASVPTEASLVIQMCVCVCGEGGGGTTVYPHVQSYQQTVPNGEQLLL